MPDPAEHLTPGELCQALGISPGTLRRWRRAGCPVVRRGRVLLFDLAAVRAWMHEVSR